jgi:hypothetical protein
MNFCRVDKFYRCRGSEESQKLCEHYKPGEFRCVFNIGIDCVCPEAREKSEYDAYKEK